MKHAVLVVGLGRFGSAAARELMLLGHEVLAIDRNEAVVNDISPDITHAVQADATDEDALRAVGRATSSTPSSPSPATRTPASSPPWRSRSWGSAT